VAALYTPLSLFNLFSWTQFKKKALVTSMLRPQDKTSVHAYGRGVDFRSSIYTAKEKKIILEFFDQFVYDSKRPKKKVLLLEEDPAHFHLQVLS